MRYTSSLAPISRDAVRTAHQWEVTPADSTKVPVEPWYLGPLDLLIPAVVPIHILFVFESVDAECIPIGLFKQAMGLVLNYYPHLSGRLQLKADHRHFLERFTAGALLTEAHSDECLADIATGRYASNPAEGKYLSLFDFPSGSNALFPPFDPSAEGLSSDAVFAVQHTRFQCGGVALGIRILHVLCDAAGFFQLVGDLSQLYGQLKAGVSNPKLSTPPSVRSYTPVFPTVAAREAALAYTPAFFDVKPADHCESLPPPSTGEVVGRELYFTAAQLAELKERCTPCEPAATGEDDWVSTFEALSSVLASAIYQARCEVGEELTGMGEYLTSMNVRQMLFDFPNEGDRYFPVGCLTPCGELPAAALRSGNLRGVGQAVHKLLRSSHLSRDAVQQNIKWLAAQPDPSLVFMRINPGGFQLSAWNSYDVYRDIHFDGPPVYVGTPFTCISLLDGLGYVLRQPPLLQKGRGTSMNTVADSQRGLVVVLALRASLWKHLERTDRLGLYMR